jgi:pilus assembly protein CpaC
MTRIIATALAISAIAIPQMVDAAKARAAKGHAATKAGPGAIMHMRELPGELRAIKPATELTLSVGRGQLVNLAGPASDVFVADDSVADVQVRSAHQIFVFAKKPGESTVFATSHSGAVVYSATIRAGDNFNSIDGMLRMAMPDAQIRSTTMNGVILLTGTVANPEDGAEAERLVTALVNKDSGGAAGGGIKVISRLKTATPLQVNLQVKIAEVNRSLSKQIGANLLNRDQSGGFSFGIAQGRNIGSIGSADISTLPKLDASALYGLPKGSLSLPFDPKIGQFVTSGATNFNISNLGLGAGNTNLALAGHLLGMDLASVIDLAENECLVTTLAQPNLTALSGETASFLAGGQFPIPIQQQLGSISIEYKDYGVSLAFTPTVLADGRISMRVRPEVSEISAEGTVRLNGFDIPGLSTRRVETTVELGSGQSFMIGGLLSNTQNNAIDRAPGLGNVPVLGAMFRSTRFRKSETELVVIVTPYLVKPTSANQIALPTDGFKAASDLERVLLGRVQSGSSGGDRPKPSSAPATTIVAPSIVGVQDRPAPSALVPNSAPPPKSNSKVGSTAAPGFSGN